MKRIALSFFSLLLVTYAFGQELAMNTTKPAKKITADNAEFTWTMKEFDFGQIKMGVPVNHEFKFTNSGDAPLLITSVQASCGCTVTSYSKDPIEAGGEGFVKATYNAASVGQFTKTVTVTANTDVSVIQLTIKGEVVQ